MSSYASRGLKDVMMRAYGHVHDLDAGVDFLGYTSTLYFAVSLFMFNYGLTGQDTACPKISEFARDWLTDFEVATIYHIT